MKRTTATEEAGPDSSNPYGEHPLPLHLDFMFGKGFLWAEDVDLSNWLTLESLRMEIPDLSFPFDAGGGVERFQHTRCRVREIEVSVDESGLAERLDRASSSLGEFEEVRVQFLEDAVHVSLYLDAFGNEAAMSFRVALLPPEPPRADEVHLSLYDYRWFGPLPYPGRLLAFEWMTGILDHPLFTAPGRGRAYQVGVAGDIASFRPFKLLLLSLFPRRGWKLPNLSDVVLDDVRMTPGRLTLRASSQDDQWQTDDEPAADLRQSREGRRALAAYESKDLFAPADEALFHGQTDEALELLSNYREQYGLHPHLASRILDCLLADPTAGHMAEARSICEELLEDNSRDLRAHLARPVMAMISKGEEAAYDAYDALSSLLRERDDTPDWILSELAVADILQLDDPGAAADRLRRVLKSTPHSLPVLERLRSLYRRLGRTEQLEDILKRLTGVYEDREKLRETYLDLARHLIHREGEVAEARHYLQKALSIDSDDLEALEALGDSYALGDKPMRAVKAFSSAARTAEARDELSRARELQFRIAALWRDELDDPEQALLSVRRAISTTETELDAAASLNRPQAIEYARQLEFAAELGEQLDRPEEAIGHWSEAVNLLERLVDADDLPSRPLGEVESLERTSPAGRLARAHDRLAQLYLEREREAAAESHWERVLELDPSDRETVDRLAQMYRRTERAEELIRLLQRRLRFTGEPQRSALLHRRLADIRDGLGDEERAEQHRKNARRFANRAEEDEPDNPWRRHEAETAPVAGSNDASGDETRDEAGSDAATKGATGTADRGPTGSDEDSPPASDLVPSGGDFAEEDADTPAFAATEDDDGSADTQSLAERLEEVRRRARQNRESKGGDESSGEFDTTSETRKFTESSSVVEHRERIRRTRPDEEPESGGEQEAAERDLEEFRDEYRQLLDSRDSPPGPEGPTPDAREEVAGDERDEDGGDGRESDDEGDEVDGESLEVPAPETLEDAQGADSAAETVQAGAAPDAEDRIAAARRGDDDRRLARVIGEVLEARERSAGSVELDADRIVELRRELAELLYYDLEETEAARPHLEQLWDEARDGPGSDPKILRALDAIYEKNGETPARIEVLERRLEEADEAEMANSYRLLLARLHREVEQPEAAERFVRQTLEADPRHEGAHRLLASIRREQSDWEAAAHHLERVLSIAGSGLDALEVEREYADLLREHLDSPEEAADHYRSVLEGAPGDSRALEGLQSCRESLEDWRGYLRGLAHELRVLLGRSEAPSPREMAELERRAVDGEAAVPVSEILAEAAEIAENKIEDEKLAWRLYGAANRIWPEHVDALVRRIELDRALKRHRALAEDLERYADSLLDAESRFEALVEAAEIWHDVEGPGEAVERFERAISAGEEASSPPDGFDDAREQLEMLRDATDDQGE